MMTMTGTSVQRVNSMMVTSLLTEIIYASSSLELVVILAKPWKMLGDRHDGPRQVGDEEIEAIAGREREQCFLMAGVAMSSCSAGKQQTLISRKIQYAIANIKSWPHGCLLFNTLSLHHGRSKRSGWSGFGRTTFYKAEYYMWQSQVENEHYSARTKIVFSSELCTTGLCKCRSRFLE